VNSVGRTPRSAADAPIGLCEAGWQRVPGVPSHELTYWACLLLVLAGCTNPKQSAPAPVPAPVEESARITQFYTTVAQVSRGETALVCYGVEDATQVWLEPPRQELSAALARCVEVKPTADTTYKLTASGIDGKSVNRELKVTVGAPRARIVNVSVSALAVKAGDLVSICYAVENARTVTIQPIGFRGATGKACATDQPRKSTTYTISASGAGGPPDVERVTVKVN
jgi:type IV pilus biogenesis protein CpaD/CtpE